MHTWFQNNMSNISTNILQYPLKNTEQKKKNDSDSTRVMQFQTFSPGIAFNMFKIQDAQFEQQNMLTTYFKNLQNVL